MPLQYDLGLVRAGGNVPKTNEVIAGSCSQDVGGSGMEDDLSNFTVDRYMSRWDMGRGDRSRG